MLNYKPQVLLFLVAGLLLTSGYTQALYFERKDLGSDVTISLHTTSHANKNRKNTCIGFASCRKIPLTSWYAIHSLYVYPAHRHQGHGSQIVKHGCELIKNLNGTRAYIQPGPFELEGAAAPTKGEPAYQNNMALLIKFYKNLGFGPVYSITSKAAALFYYLAGIDENARHLMVKQL